MTNRKLWFGIIALFSGMAASMVGMLNTETVALILGLYGVYVGGNVTSKKYGPSYGGEMILTDPPIMVENKEAEASTQLVGNSLTQTNSDEIVERLARMEACLNDIMQGTEINGKLASYLVDVVNGTVIPPRPRPPAGT